jgi:putative membrane protein
MVITLALLTQCGHTKKEDGVKEAEAINKQNFDTKQSRQESEFVVDAVAGNYAEIEMAQLAINKSANDEVRSIARMLKKEHTELLTQLKGFANKRGIAIPLEEKEEDHGDLKDLSKKEEPGFDEKWCKEMVNSHEKAIKSFEATWDKTNDLELKEWIYNTLPGFRKHLDKLKQCDERLVE